MQLKLPLDVLDGGGVVLAFALALKMRQKKWVLSIVAVTVALAICAAFVPSENDSHSAAQTISQAGDSSGNNANASGSNIAINQAQGDITTFASNSPNQVYLKNSPGASVSQSIVQGPLPSIIGTQTLLTNAITNGHFATKFAVKVAYPSEEFGLDAHFDAKRIGLINDERHFEKGGTAFFVGASFPFTEVDWTFETVNQIRDGDITFEIFKVSPK